MSRLEAGVEWKKQQSDSHTRIGKATWDALVVYFLSAKEWSVSQTFDQ